MDKLKDYTFKVFWSEKDQAFVGICEGFSSLSHIDETPAACFRGILDLVQSVLEEQ